MRLVYLCNEYPPAPHGGVGTFTASLATRLAARGHAIHVIGLYPCTEPQHEQTDGVAVTRLPASHRRFINFLLNRRCLARELWRIHAENPIDVVEGPEMALSLVPRQFPTTKLIRMHGGYHFFNVLLKRKFRRTRGWVEMASFRNADRLCAVSRFVADETSKLLSLKGRAVEILPNPIDTCLFRPRPEVSEESGLAVFAGAINQKKGICELIDAVQIVSREVPNFKLCLVGRDSFWPGTSESFLERVLSKQASAVRQRVIHKAQMPNQMLPEFLARGQVLVFPSHLEAQGMVIGEGMAMGKAVVTTQTGPGPELIRHDEDGRLCDPFDPQSIARELIACLKDPDLRQRLGKNARNRVRAELGIDHILARNETFYRRII